MGVFAMIELAAQAQYTEMVMIYAIHRTASSLAVQNGGRTKGRLNSKQHVLADAKGRTIHMFLSAGQTSDYIGVRALLPTIP